MKKILEGKRILITGGTGSLGKSLVRRVISGERGDPAKVIVLSRDEGKQHEMRLAYLSKSASTDEVIYRNFLNMLEFSNRETFDPMPTFAAQCETSIL